MGQAQAKSILLYCCCCCCTNKMRGKLARLRALHPDHAIKMWSVKWVHKRRLNLRRKKTTNNNTFCRKAKIVVYYRLLSIGYIQILKIWRFVAPPIFPFIPSISLQPSFKPLIIESLKQYDFMQRECNYSIGIHPFLVCALEPVLSILIKLHGSTTPHTMKICTFKRLYLGLHDNST